ncbi:MAG: helix-hairpin-helix domain-containing protein [Bacteroidota bacterium]
MFRKIKFLLIDYFHFNKQERNGVFILFTILMILITVKLSLPFFVKNDAHLQMNDLTYLDSLSISDDKQVDKVDFSNKKETIIIHQTLFDFNPNTIVKEEALKLGFSEKLSTTLINFRNKGGQFFKPEDLKKLYGISQSLYKSLEPHIIIPNEKKEIEKDNSFQKSFSKKIFTKNILELNTADSMQLVALRGVGPAFTKRIIKFRNKLGGFHHLNQLKEVYGMTDSLFLMLSEQVKIDPAKITLIPINEIDLNSLKKHPYLNFQTAQAIINFRMKHGKILEKDIIDLGVFNSQQLSLLLPYFSY